MSYDDRRLNNLVKTAVKWCSEKADVSTDEESYQKMLFTLEQCDYSFQKTQLILEMNKAEMDRYSVLNSEIEQSIKERQENIVSAREDLKEAKEIRKNRQQYDALAKVIQRHPERTRTQNEIKELQEEMERLKTSREKLISKLELRKRQFHLLVHSIHELQRLLEEEETSEESYLESPTLPKEDSGGDSMDVS